MSSGVMFINSIRSTLALPQWINPIRKLRCIFDEITGYDRILSLKQSVHDASQRYQQANANFKSVQLSYQSYIDSRAALQRRIQGLLSRKSTWTEEEISQFTALYKEEIKAETKEDESKLETMRASQAMDEAHAILINSMKERYQGEQAWSDKIRLLSTMATLALLMANGVFFVYMQLILEPKRRKSMVDSIKAGIPLYPSLSDIVEKLEMLQRNSILPSPEPKIEIETKEPVSKFPVITAFSITSALLTLLCIRLYSP